MIWGFNFFALINFIFKDSKASCYILLDSQTLKVVYHQALREQYIVTTNQPAPRLVFTLVSLLDCTQIYSLQNIIPFFILTKYWTIKSGKLGNFTHYNGFLVSQNKRVFKPTQVIKVFGFILEPDSIEDLEIKNLCLDTVGNSPLVYLTLNPLLFIDTIQHNVGL